MMKEQVIITKISINRQGERKHFQIKLPKKIKYIIGVEYGGRMISRSDAVIIKLFPVEPVLLPLGLGAGDRSTTLFVRNQLIGELKLQSCEESNWFFSCDVFNSDKNLGLADFSQSGFPVNDYTHGNKRTEEIVKVDAESTIIQGWYLDAIGKSQKTDISYEVNVYVWINVEE